MQQLHNHIFQGSLSAERLIPIKLIGRDFGFGTSMLQLKYFTRQDLSFSAGLS